MSVISSLVFGAQATAALQVIVCPFVALNESINEEMERDQTDTWDEGRGEGKASLKILPATRDPIKMAFPRIILGDRLYLPFSCRVEKFKNNNFIKRQNDKEM